MSGADVPAVWYQGEGLGDRRFLHANNQGSIVARTGATASVSAINNYDEYGIPTAGNTGRVQYTGQVWIPGLGTKPEDGYPPEEGESLCAIPVNDGYFKIDNIPFYAKNLSCDDVVEACREGDAYVFERVVTRSDNST